MGSFATGLAAAGRFAAGRRTVNSLPFPSPSLAAVIWPPCISTNFLTIVRPMPKPPSARAEEWSTWLKRSNVSGSFSGGMRIPESLTRMTTSVPSFSDEGRMVPPSSLYLAALFSRLTTTCSRRVKSASTRNRKRDVR